MILSKGSLSYDLAMIIKYNCGHSLLVLATVITIVNYDCKIFIVQAIVSKLRLIDRAQAKGWLVFVCTGKNSVHMMVNWKDV